MLLRVIKAYREVVAVCDTELIGKRFEEGSFQLDVKESFFRGDEVGDEEALMIMRQKMAEDATFNIVGERAIRAAITAGVVSEREVGSIRNVPFSLALI